VTELLAVLRKSQVSQEGEIADRSDFQSHALANAAFSEEHRRIIDSVGIGEIKEALLVDDRGYHLVQHAPTGHATRRYEIRSLPLFKTKPPYAARLLGGAAVVLGAWLILQIHDTGAARTALADQKLMASRDLISQRKQLKTEFEEIERQLGAQLDKARAAKDADETRYTLQISDLKDKLNTANGKISKLSSQLTSAQKENAVLKANISKLQAEAPELKDAKRTDSDVPESK